MISCAVISTKYVKMWNMNFSNVFNKHIIIGFSILWHYFYFGQFPYKLFKAWRRAAGSPYCMLQLCLLRLKFSGRFEVLLLLMWRELKKDRTTLGDNSIQTFGNQLGVRITAYIVHISSRINIQSRQTIMYLPSKIPKPWCIKLNRLLAIHFRHLNPPPILKNSQTHV